MENYEIQRKQIDWAIRQALKNGQFEEFDPLTPYVDSKMFNYILSQERFWPALNYLNPVTFDIEDRQAFVNAYVLLS